MKLILTSLLVATTGLLSLQAIAIDGTIEFTGTINDNTCAVTVNDGNAHATIDLGTVQASSLAKEQSTAGGATFTVQIQAPDGDEGKCDLKGKTGTIRFVPMSGTAGDKQQYLGLKSGGAEQVAIRIIDQYNNLLSVGQDSQTQYSLEKPLTFSADYIALGTATPGKAEAKAGFVINYK